MKKTSIFLLTALCLLVSSSAMAKEEKPQKAPLFPRRGLWLNAEKPLGSKIFENQITLIYFWDYSSVNCVREMGILKQWYQLYHPYGLGMIWVHAPEFDFAWNSENVQKSLKRLKVPFPVFLDNDFKVWDAYKVKSWPTKFLINEDGLSVFSHVGEAGYVQTERAIRKHLRKFNPGVVLPEPLFHKEPKKFSMRKCGLMSGDTYLGYKRATWWGAEIANKKWTPVGKAILFKDRGERVEKGFFAEGLWENKEDYLAHARNTEGFRDYVGLIYLAREVYATLNRTEGTGPSRIYVTRDENPVPPALRGVDLHVDDEGGTYFLIQEPRLYYLIANEDSEPHEIKLWARSRGVAVDSFSFSNRCMSDFEHL